MDLSEFLVARLAEDAANAEHSRDVVDCDARRRLVQLHEVRLVSTLGYGKVEGHEPWYVPGSHDDIVSRHWMCRICGNVGDDGPCATLRLLARRYADHPDYREEWLPSGGP